MTRAAARVVANLVVAVAVAPVVYVAAVKLPWLRLARGTLWVGVAVARASWPPAAGGARVRHRDEHVRSAPVGALPPPTVQECTRGVR